MTNNLREKWNPRIGRRPSYHSNFLFSPKQLFFAFLIFAFYYAANAQAAEMRALIIGVSDYPTLPAFQQLQAPRNDVVRLREVLTHRGFKPQQIAVLADGVAGAGLPTHVNILAELDRLAQTSRQGDLVVLYFAGHGSLQPVIRRTTKGRAETTSMQEIFLPRDIGKWSPTKGKVANALVKMELRKAVDGMLAKGVFVWGIFDACHSATLVRGAEGGIRYRGVDPELLGVAENGSLTAVDSLVEPIADDGADNEVLPPTRGRPEPLYSPSNDNNNASTSNAIGQDRHGGSVFFYAAQHRESTPELRLPIGQTGAKPFGLFSYVVAQALDAGMPMTYRQMAQYILTRYGAMNETAVTPFFSGTDLDQPVLSQNAPVVQQWKIEAGPTMSIHAGALSQLTIGTLLAIVPNPLTPSEQAIGYVSLNHVELSSATAESVAYRGKSALQIASLPKGSFARLVQAVPDYRLIVSIDASKCAAECPLSKIIAGLRNKETSVMGTAITWLDAPAHGDVMLKLLPDRVVLLSPSLQGADCSAVHSCAQAIQLRLDKADAAPKAKSKDPLNNNAHSSASVQLLTKLVDSLHAIARAENLLKIAAQLSDRGESSSKVAVTTKIVSKAGPEVAYTVGHVPTLHSGDRLHVTLRNRSDSAVDSTILYIDAHFGISVLFPQEAGAGNRLEPNASEEFDVEINANTIGIERMLAISVDAMPNRERTDFSFLAQPTLTDLRGRDGAFSADNDVAAFMDAGFASYLTRGPVPVPTAPGTRTALQVFSFDVRP
jgi:hypothetical protein